MNGAAERRSAPNVANDVKAGNDADGSTQEPVLLYSCAGKHERTGSPTEPDP
jgi:hypothetical protein